MNPLDPKYWGEDTLDSYARLATDGPKQTARGRRWAISAEHPLATLTGKRTLQSGGSAADAFVAMAVAEHVLMPGTTTLGGVFGGVYHDGPTGETIAINAGLNAPLEDGTLGTPDEPYDHLAIKETGRAIMVPGAIRGLEALHQRFGRLAWSDLWMPAIFFARHGFPMYELYHRNMLRRRDVLLRHPGGRANFAPGGELPPEDGLFAQPILADTLESIAAEGADYCYTGPWAETAVQAIQACGGRITMEDFRRYEVRWDEPIAGTYLQYELRTVVPPHYAGAGTLTGLKILEHLGLHESAPPTTDGKVLYEEIQVFRSLMDDRSAVVDLRRADAEQMAEFRRSLADEYAAEVAQSIRAGIERDVSNTVGTHSHNLVAADEDGSMVTATYTIHSDSWGDPGVIVEGISLNSAAHALLTYRPAPGERIAEPLSAYIAYQNGEPVLASTVIGSGLVGCQLQNTLNVLGRGVSLEESIGRPRYGFFEFDLAAMTTTEKIQVESFDSGVLDAVESLGQPLARKSFRWEGHAFADTGYWAAIQRHPGSGELESVTDPRLPGLAAAG
jgi:gamma-glutamyltranspeptidase/glutathione hydrolase